ncbi:MAG: pro-sigmaK processing inhibitor BofA family protein [Candidatus Howiella sp.]|jgi:pro-sigmaK processing inhibitor BofA
MEILKTILIILAAVYAIAFLFFAFKTGKPLKTILLHLLLGLLAFLALNLTSGYTGVRLGVNPWSVLCASAAGVPGVALMVLMRLIWLI